jgi:hypothetical protein
MPNGSSSMSFGELWPGIDQLDVVGPRNASVAPAQNQGGARVLHSHVVSHKLKAGYGSSCRDREAPDSSTASSHGCRGGYAKNKAT